MDRSFYIINTIVCFKDGVTSRTEMLPSPTGRLQGWRQGNQGVSGRLSEDQLSARLGMSLRPTSYGSNPEELLPPA